MGERGASHLQHGFSKENHLLPGFFYDKVLYLVPIIVCSTGSEVHFINSIFFVTCRSSCRFMGYIGDKIVYGGRVIRRGVQV